MSTDVGPAQESLFGGTDRADAAAKAILRRQLAAIDANETGVLRREHEEFLHDYRIAVRRSRSALGQLKGVFPQRAVRRFAPKFAWLGLITSPPRDLDVYLAGFDELKSSLPEPYREPLEPLREILAQRADWAYGELFRQLSSSRYRQLMSAWRQFLAAPLPARPSAPQALLTALELANRRIWKLYRRALKQGQAIGPSSPPDDLHTLRKTCKKLRYLLEFFQSLYPPNKIRSAIKQLKRLQDYLGEFQDIHVQVATLHDIAVAMRKDPQIAADTLLSMGALLAHLDRRQMRLRNEFSSVFKDFARHEHQARYRQLFHPPG